MKTTTPNCEEALHHDLEALAPLVKEGFARINGPSARVLKAIHEEAVAHALRRAARNRFAFIVRFTAVAAAVALVFGGSLQAWRAWHAIKPINQTVQLLRISTQNSTSVEHELADSSELANYLLSMQGFDRDSYFSAPDGMESLWL